jgi:hypothetical protein
MRKILMIQILTLTTLISFGQIKSIDLNKIRSLANKDSYNKLFDRFIANDTTLSLDDYVIIYYGQAFRENYKPNARHDSVKVLNMYLNNNKDSIDFHKVLSYTNMILNDFPFNIEQIYIAWIAYDKIGVKDSSDIWFYKYDRLIRTIMSSGDGKTPKTAFIVAKITDEYSILNALGLQLTGQALISKKKKSYDLMNVAQNQYGIDKLYFDINLFFGKWR